MHNQLDFNLIDLTSLLKLTSDLQAFDGCGDKKGQCGYGCGCENRNGQCGGWVKEN